MREDQVTSRIINTSKHTHVSAYVVVAAYKSVIIFIKNKNHFWNTHTCGSAGGGSVGGVYKLSVTAWRWLCAFASFSTATFFLFFYSRCLATT